MQGWKVIRRSKAIEKQLSEFYYEPDVIGEALQNLMVTEESKQFI